VLFPESSDADQDTQAIADLYAAEGYVALCPSGDFDATNVADITATIAALRQRNECTGKVGALGFGHGGKLTYLAAARTSADCAVAYYGSGIDTGLDLSLRINCPLVMHFAENDPHVPPEAVERIKAAFAASSDVATYRYPGVGREFTRPDSADFDKPAAGLAHPRSLALLRRMMGRITTSRRCGKNTRSTNSAPAMSRRRCVRWWPSPMSTTSQ
jgi:carboxymethylenebutenolidase